MITQVKYSDELLGDILQYLVGNIKKNIYLVVYFFNTLNTILCFFHKWVLHRWCTYNGVHIMVYI